MRLLGCWARVSCMKIHFYSVVILKQKTKKNQETLIPRKKFRGIDTAVITLFGLSDIFEHGEKQWFSPSNCKRKLNTGSYEHEQLNSCGIVWK